MNASMHAGHPPGKFKVCVCLEDDKSAQLESIAANKGHRDQMQGQLPYTVVPEVRRVLVFEFLWMCMLFA